MKCRFSTIALLLLAGPLWADTLHVPKDHPTIQAGIDAAKPGDKVLVEPGTYRESVRLKAGVIVQSAGDDAKGKLGLKRAEGAILDGGGAAAKGPAVVLADGAVLDGFTITRVGAFDQKEYDKHYATQGENLPDDQGAVGKGKDFPAIGIVGVTATVRHCIVHDNGHAGIGCIGAHDKKNYSRITKNIVYRNMGGGIGIADGATPTVEANTCFNNLRAGIGNRNSAGLILKNECYDNVRAGIGIREGAKPIVRNNKCYKNRRAGIGVRMEGTAPIIEDNDCYQNAMAGIGARDGAAPLILRNRCYENALAGIGSRDGATAKIFGNKCYRNKMAGIGTQLGAKAFIAHNECYENEKAGIGQSSDAETTIGGNHVHHNKSAGIGFDECKTGKSLVIHNRVIDNELVAIGIHAGWKVRVADNILSRNGGMPPIVMVFKGAEADFVENTIKGSGVAGIRSEGTIRVVNNKFECANLRKGGGPPQFAVWGLPGSDIVFLENTVKGWRHALQADKASVNASYNQISGYWQAGIRVTQPTSPVTAIGNVFWSKDGHQGLALPKGEGLVEDNRFEKADPPKEKEP
jgi:parallel beta-helix repeat protein